MVSRYSSYWTANHQLGKLFLVPPLISKEVNPPCKKSDFSDMYYKVQLDFFS